MDVSGGSAELLISQNGELIDAVSKPLGAVRPKEVFLKTDPPQASEIAASNAYVDEKLLSFHRMHGNEKFDYAIVTSVTAFVGDHLRGSGRSLLL